MATQQAEIERINDITVCSICVEKLKTPRFLPCKHSFCHDCLLSYIASQCKSTEPRLEFHCPVCRQYFPGNGDVDKPENWVKRFPVNVSLQNIIALSNKKQCELCLKDNEKAATTNYCWTCTASLCALCTKYHLKFPALNDHKIVKFSEFDSSQSIPVFGISNHCPIHLNEQVQLYCAGHEQPCCGLCGATEHKKCARVELISTAVQSLNESGKFESLLKETNAFKEKLLLAKSKEENNISEIESSMKEKKSKFEGEFNSIMQHLEKLRNEYLEEMALTLKEGKDKLHREIERLEDSILCTNSCIQGVQTAKDADNDTERIMKFCTSADTFRNLKKSHLKETEMKYETAKTVAFKEIPDLQRIAIVNLIELSSLIEFDVENIVLSVFKKFSIERGNLTSAVVLSGGSFLAVNKTEGKCLMYDEQWNCSSVINDLKNPHDITENEEGIFVTTLNTIEVYSSRHFQHLRSIPMSNALGITSFEGRLFVSCIGSILNIDSTGKVNTICETQTSTYTISATRHGLILWVHRHRVSDLFQKTFIEKVIAMTDKGVTAWEYQSSSLIEAHGLDVDSRDQIYVAGKGSNNVHILSNAGQLIRVIENIPNPLFFKINEASGTVFVGSGEKEVIVYKF